MMNNRRHLIPVAFEHMELPSSPVSDSYVVYTYLFSDNSLYFGLTCNVGRRHRSHMSDANSPVFCKLNSGGTIASFSITGLFTAKEAGALEAALIAEYRQKKDFVVLNTKNGGEFGSICLRHAWTYSELIACARLCSSRTEFTDKNKSAAKFAKEEGLYEQIVAQMGWPRHTGHVWTLDKCVTDARRFEYHSDWVKDGKGYYAAMKHGWLTQVREIVNFEHPVAKDVTWTFEACLARAKEFTRASDWQYKAGDGSHCTARRKKWLAAITKEAYPNKPARVTHDLREKIRAYADAGKPSKEIALMLGVRLHAVKNARYHRRSVAACS